MDYESHIQAGEDDTPTGSPARSSRGATAVEYALIIALIAAIIIGTVASLGERTQGLFKTTENRMTDEGL